MRLFVAIDIEQQIRERIATFLEGLTGFVPEARWVQPESLHITLKFIGEKSEGEVEHIKRALGAVQAGSFLLNIQGYGFFPTSSAPRVFWIGVEDSPDLRLLASGVDQTLGVLGIPKEEHGFNPHLTLARAGNGHRGGRRGTGSRSASFRRLQDKLASLPSPQFGTMTAREFFLFQSRLSPSGSKYTKLARFGLQ